MRQYLPLAAAAATGVQVGAALVATRFVVDQTGPMTLALMRYAIGFCCLLPPLLLAPRSRIAPRDLLPIALLGIGQFGILIALINYGLHFITAARGALLFATFPLLTMVLAAALGRERLTWTKSIAVSLSILGVALALGEKLLLPGTGASEWLGSVAVLASALVGAVCSVLYRPYLVRYPTLQVSAYAMLASVAFLALAATGEGLLDGLPRLTQTGLAAVVFIGISSGVGYFLWLWALTHASPTKVTVFLSLSPVTAAVLGATLLDEPLTMGAILGLLAVMASLWLANQQWGAAGPAGSAPRGGRT